jgi:hypothetical protein
MDIMADRTKFLTSDPTRLVIAEWCAAESLSRETIAARLKRRSGSLSAPDTMLRRKALLHAGLEAKAGPGRRAELLKLNPKWREPLRQALTLRRPGRLEEGTDLLLIPLAATGRACEALLREDMDLEWGARLDGEQLGLILSPKRDPHGAATIRAAAALDRAGVRAARVRLQSVMAAGELRSWASLVGGEGRRDLPSQAG